MHGSQNILLRGLAHWILLIVGENHHVFSLVAKVIVQIGGHIFDIVDASSQLPSLPEIVDPDEQGFTATCASRVLKVVSLGSAGSEALHGLWRRWRSIGVPIHIGVRVDGRHT